MLDDQIHSSPALTHTANEYIEMQVAHAQKMQALMRLVSAIAHDFDNIWASIAGYTDLMLLYTPESDPIQADLKQISKATNTATCLMRKLADFARIGRLGGYPFDLGELLVKQTRQLQHLLGPNIQLMLQLTPNPWLVKGHMEQIAQLVAHLATNAREAMSSGGTLRLVVENIHVVQPLTNQFVAVPQGEYVALTVVDNGPGIAPAIQEHVFEPGVSTKHGERGVGLGLATCYSIAQQHDSFIWLDTAPGQGTVVSLYLPRAHDIDTLTPYEPYTLLHKPQRVLDEVNALEV